ncbi:MAG TPA: DNA translocase FtsK 4TM domain-containing protein, partial [Thermoanaerobaculia bacterium]|nr:DNA translocase FtsK 4TM domain-containing protein [Thermoanaerobaculia bacterium]
MSRLHVAGVMGVLEFARSRRGGELIGIVVLAIGISLGLAILTYHPNDSSAFYTSTTSAIQNWIGYYGATLAWIFVNFFGFASLLFPAVLIVLGWQRFWGRDLDYVHTKLIGFTTVALALPPFFDLALGKVWLRGALIPSGGYLGSEINRAVSGNLNRSGAAIALVTALLIGVLLATRISLAAVFVALHQKLAAAGREISRYWARFFERRRKDKMKVAIVRKHLEPQLRLVTTPPVDDDTLTSPIVREVKGAGRFQIRKVTKADLRKAAEELSKQETQNPFEWYSRQPERSEGPPADVRRTSFAEIQDDTPDFEDPLYLDDPLPSPPPRPKPQVARPAVRKPIKEAKRETRLTHDLLPTMNLLAEGPKQDTINDEVHKKFLEIGHLIEERCREFAVEGEVTAYHPG